MADEDRKSVSTIGEERKSVKSVYITEHDTSPEEEERELMMPSLKEPIERLKLLQDQITHQTERIKSAGNQAKYDSGEIKQLQDDVQEAKELFHELKTYCNNYADTSHHVGSTFGDLSKDLADLVKSNLKQSEDVKHEGGEETKDEGGEDKDDKDDKDKSGEDSD